jgi:hypothetical protein
MVLLLCQACGSGTEDANQRMTQSDAMNRADDYVHRAVALLPPGAKLEVLSETATHDCDDPTDNGPKGRVFASNLYWVRGITEVDSTKYLDGLRRWWGEQGFAVVTDAWEKAKVITLENPENGFRMSFRKSAPDPAIGASSPCVWP